MKTSTEERTSSVFTDIFVSLNGLGGEEGFAEWHFKKGMRFGEAGKWWIDGGRRPHLHEGVDFCYYVAGNGAIKTVSPDTCVPPLYAGKVVNVFDDFIGRTILLKHRIAGDNNLQLYSLYGHVNPLPHIVIGADVDFSEKMATIADRNIKKRPMPSHLHLSTIWLPHFFPAETFHWGMEDDIAVFFCDPLDFFFSKRTPHGNYTYSSHGSQSGHWSG
jgi:hypothetical protein